MACASLHHGPVFCAVGSWQVRLFSRCRLSVATLRCGILCFRFRLVLGLWTAAATTYRRLPATSAGRAHCAYAFIPLPVTNYIFSAPLCLPYALPSRHLFAAGATCNSTVAVHLAAFYRRPNAR